MKFLKLSILSFVALLATTSLAFAQTAAATVQTTKVEATKTVKVKVKGVGCAMDLKSISANVEKLDGVNSCETVKKGAITTFKVQLNPALVGKEEVHAAIENTAGCQNPKDRPYKVKL